MSLKDKLALLTASNRRDLVDGLLFDVTHDIHDHYSGWTKLEIIELRALMFEGVIGKMNGLCPPALPVAICEFDRG